MKYIKQFESSQLLVSISVALFPDVSNKNNNTGKWSTFFGAHNKKIEQQYFNIIWQKYFGVNDPCENKQLGPCRPEFLSYPIELVNILIYFNYIIKNNVIEFEESDKKIYWKYSNQEKEPEVRGKYPESDISMKIEFNSIEEALDWLDILKILLNDINKKEEIEGYILSKKYNL